MKTFFLCALLLGCAQAADFDPKVLDDYVIVAEGFCEPYQCVLATKDSNQYVISFDTRGRIVAIYEVHKDDSFVLVWHRDFI